MFIAAGTNFSEAGFSSHECHRNRFKYLLNFGYRLNESQVSPDFNASV